MLLGNSQIYFFFEKIKQTLTDRRLNVQVLFHFLQNQTSSTCENKAIEGCRRVEGLQKGPKAGRQLQSQGDSQTRGRRNLWVLHKNRQVPLQVNVRQQSHNELGDKMFSLFIRARFPIMSVIKLSKKKCFWI